MSQAVRLLSDDAVRRFVALCRRDIDPAVRVTELWSVRDVAAHLAGGLGYYTELLTGTPSELAGVDQIATKNAELVAATSEQALPVLADQIEAGWTRFTESADALPAATNVYWHGGVDIPVATMVALLLAEAEVHGYDIAHAVKKPWVISADAAAEVLWNLRPVLPLFLDADAAGRFKGRVELRIRTRPERVYLAIEDGVLTVEDQSAGPVSCRIVGRGHDLMLVLFGRKGPWGPALGGHLVSYGRRPWLGLKLPGYFRAP